MTFSDSLIRWPLICCVCSLAMMSAAAQAQTPLRDWPKERLVEQLEFKKKELESIEQKRPALVQQLEAIPIEIESATKERIERDQAIAQSTVAPESHKEVSTLLQTMRVQLKIDLAGLRSRLKVLSEDKPDDLKIQLLNELRFVEDKLHIARTIEKLSFELRDKAEELFKKGVISLEELNERKIEAETASLRVVELTAEFEEKRAAASGLSRPVLAAIQQTGLEIAEKEARLGQVDEQLTAAIRVGRQIEESNQIMQRIAGLEQRRDSIKEKVEKLDSAVKERLDIIKELEEELAKR